MEKMDLGLPLDWHPDGTPIFLRGDIIRDPRTIGPDNGVIYDNLVLPEHRHLSPQLRFNYLCLSPVEEFENCPSIWLGKSAPDVRRGYIFGRVIQALDSSCRVIVQRYNNEGSITNFILLTLQPFQFVLVPPNYECILLNVSNKLPARFFEVKAKEEVRNIEVLTKYNGPGYILQGNGNLIPNIEYNELSIPQIHPGLEEFRFLRRRSLYTQFVEFSKYFDFIDPPREEFFIGSL